MKQLNRFFGLLLSGRITTPKQFFQALKEERFAAIPADTSAERFIGTYDDTARFVAPERLKLNKEYFTSALALRQHDRADWQHTDWQIQAFSAKLIEAARKRGIPLFVHSAFRTEDEQNLLYSKKRSKARYPRAAHCQGKAVDIVHSRYAWQLTPSEWQYLGKLGKDIAQQMGVQITWGGDWKFYDPAHWELVGWKTDIQHFSTSTPIRKTPRALLKSTMGLK